MNSRKHGKWGKSEWWKGDYSPNWKIYILNLMAQPVGFKTGYFLFKLIDPVGGSGS